MSEMTCAKPRLVGVAIFTDGCRYPRQRNPSTFIPLLDRIHHAVICMAQARKLFRASIELYLVQDSKWRFLSWRLNLSRPGRACITHSVLSSTFACLLNCTFIVPLCELAMVAQ
jgi:hypothetical protein